MIHHVTVLLLAISVYYPVSSVVRAPWGSIQGVEIEGQGGRRLSAYMGIPFALPPTGQLRWQKPQPHPGPGEGQVFVADTLKPACPQEVPGLGVYVGINEDCLTLNVYTPVWAESVASPIPVMIFIHGGGFSFGDAPTYRPSKLVSDGGVIVVTIQYRLGTLGFLTTGDDLVLGNLGLWDQTLAIRWVKDNIRAFNGDPETITIFGESAGSVSVGLHILSPQSKGLFQRAIMQSGPPNVLSGFIYDGAENFKLLSIQLDCETESTEKMLQCLKTRSADDIVNVSSVLIARLSNNVLFLPRVDGDWLPGDPLQLLQDEQYVLNTGIGDLDLVVGFNNNEGALVLMTLALKDTPMETFHDPGFFAAMLDASVRLQNKGQSDEVAKKVVEFFYRGADMGTNASVPLKVLTQMYGDSFFCAHSVEWIRTLASQPHTGCRYLYLFDHDFSFNKQGPVPGSHHADELFTEFDMLVPEKSIFEKLNKTGISAEEEPLSDLFVNMLTEFTKTGKPSGALKDVLGGDWPEFTSEDEAYLALSLTPRVERDVYRERMALWLKLLPQITSAVQRPQGEQLSASYGKDEL